MRINNFLTRTEQRGLIMMAMVLVVIRSLMMLVNWGPKALQTAGNQVDMPPDRVFQNIQKSIEINTADSLQFSGLRGVGKVLSGRIVRYRELLGGFVRVNQLVEVYGLDSAWLGQVRDRLRVDTGRIRLLNINHASFGQLLRHPYLDYEQVKAIVRYRERHGPLIHVSSLYLQGVLPDSVWIKVKPYLCTR